MRGETSRRRQASRPHGRELGECRVGARRARRHVPAMHLLANHSRSSRSCRANWHAEDEFQRLLPAGGDVYRAPSKEKARLLGVLRDDFDAWLYLVASGLASARTIRIPESSMQITERLSLTTYSFH
jgi:hypothetical protein